MPETKPDLLIDERGRLQRLPLFEHRDGGRLGEREARARASSSTATGHQTARTTTASSRSAAARTAPTRCIRLLELGMNPLVRHRHDRPPHRHRPAQHREHQAARRRLRRGHARTRWCGAASTGSALDADRRHLLARARHHLHHPGAGGGAARDPADRLGREPTERVRRPGGRAPDRTSSPGAGWRSSAACSGFASAISSARRESSSAT